MSLNIRNSDLTEVATSHSSFNSLLPHKLGGEESNLSSFCESVENIAIRDGSAAWCFMIGSVLNGAVAAYVSDQAINDIFENQSLDLPPTIFAGQTSPRSEIELIDNGVLLSGDFKFGSGLQHASWVVCGFINPNDNEHYLATLPKKNVVLRGNWDVFGLSGTGSQDYQVNKQIVLNSHIFRHDTKTPLRGGKTFSCGIVTVMLTGHIGVALGLAEQLLRDLQTLTKIARRSGQLNERDDFLIELGRQKASLFAAKAFSEKALRCIDNAALKNEVKQDDHDKIRMVAIHVTEISRSIARFAFDYSGMNGASNDSNINKLFRDVHVASQHLLVNSSQYKSIMKRMIG